MSDNDHTQTKELQVARWQSLIAELEVDESERERVILLRRLEERAKQYAARKQDSSTFSEEEAYHVLVFRLGAEQYALEVDTVRNVRPATRITRVPGTPPFYRGVVNWRGQIVTVLDLRIFFHTGGNQPGDALPDELILVEAGGLELALLADHVEDVSVIPVESIEPIEMSYAYGVTRSQMVILDIQKLFMDERLIVGGVTQNE